ncbi:MAG: bifunctional 2',3'-cyclic-nucleotide 2'-phosphodiesterase/3'-nucleotidase [Burkholderiaceae bacterium]
MKTILAGKTTRPRAIPGVVASAALTLLAACGGSHDDSAPKPAQGTTAQVTLLETTDLHQNILSYNYYTLAEDDSVGLERTATLIKQARAKYANTMLFDAGDIIQGTVLGDYQALVNKVPCTDELAIFKAMDAIGYDAGTIGNHEFNYGLPYLAQVTGKTFNVKNMPAVASQTKCKGPAYPQVLANVVSTTDGKPIFDPYVILDRQVTATTPDGKTVTATIKVGVIGFTPPQIMAWDKGNLDGNVTTIGLKEAAEQYVPEMKAKGADLIVAVSHGGPDNAAYSPTMENGNLYLAQVPGIDVLLQGHMHQVFPNANSTVAAFNIAGVDKTAGTVAGVPSVMANFWGKNLGVVNLTLTYGANGWTVDKTKSAASTMSTQNADKSYVAADPSIAPLVKTEHDGTVAYVKTPIGDSDFRMSTYFADVGDVTAIEPVNQAQASYVKAYVQANLPQYKSLPVLSVSAPFKSGFAGGSDYTDVANGSVAIFNAADLYLYANTIQAVLVTGADIKAWLETAAQRFNQIDPTKTTPQALVSSFPGYNFDVMDGDGSIKYEIDVTQPVGSRIKNLTWNGNAIDPAAQFIVATNNYRASGGGNFPGLNGSKTIYQSPDANRDVLIAYVKAQKTLAKTVNGSDRSWHFTPVTTAGPVTFTSKPGNAALAAADGIPGVTQLQADDGSGKGLAVYQIDLSAQ